MTIVKIHAGIGYLNQCNPVMGKLILKYGSQEKVPFWCRCPIFLSLTFVGLFGIHVTVIQIQMAACVTFGQTKTFCFIFSKSYHIVKTHDCNNEID